MQQLTEKYCPSNLDGFIGVDVPAAIMRAVAAVPYESAWLLIGPSGLGKTTMALKCAEQIGGQVYHVPSRQCDLAMVEDLTHKCAYKPFIGDWNVVIVDEADQMTKAAQHAFLSLLDATGFPKSTIFLFTANDDAALEDRFLSRVRRVTFSVEGMDVAIAKLLERIWLIEAPDAPPPCFLQIAKDARCNVRTAIMELETRLLLASIAPPVKSVTSAPDSDIIDSYSLAEHFQIGLATLYKWVQKGKLPQPHITKPRMAWRKEEVIS